MSIEPLEFTAGWDEENISLAVDYSPPLLEQAGKIAIIACILWNPIVGSLFFTSYVGYKSFGHMVNRKAHQMMLPSAHRIEEEQIEMKNHFSQFWEGPITDENRAIRERFDLIHSKVTTPDGAELKVMWIKHKNADQKTRTTLYFNGNFQICEQFPASVFEEAVKTDQCCSFILFNYRGVDGSTGNATRFNDLVLDGHSVLQWIRRGLNIADDNINFYGFSLGGVVAAHTQALSPDKLIGPHVNHNSFGNSDKMIYSRCGKGIAGWITNWLFEWQGYSANSAEAFRKLQGEKLIVLNPNDWIIPYHVSLQAEVQHDNVIELHPKAIFREVSARLKHHATPLECHEGVREKIWDFLYKVQDVSRKHFRQAANAA